METDEKVRENRLRRMAERQGLRLVKSRRRDPRALDYGLYVLVQDTAGDKELDAQMKAFENGDKLTLDEVDSLLTA